MPSRLIVPVALLVALMLANEASSQDDSILVNASYQPDDEAQVDDSYPRDGASPAEPYVGEATQALSGEAFRPYENFNAPCSSCSGGGSGYSRCGCNPQFFPWIKGPGRCDQWCVGPHWQVEVDGLMLYRPNANWDRVTAGVGVAPEFTSQFGHSPGARVFATAYNDSGYGMQVGYEGVSSWNARAEYDLGGATRSFDYKTSLNSVEINFLSPNAYRWKFFAGFRYVEVDEDFRDFTKNDIAVPAPTDPPAAPFATVDNGQSYILQNRLLGFQIGSLRDTWQINRRFTVKPFANAGIYCNTFKRTDIQRTVTTVVAGDDLSTPDMNEYSKTSQENIKSVRRDFTEAAFLGEAGVSGSFRINRCVALRGGYQVLIIDGVGEALAASFSPGVNGTSQLYQGLNFGVEYRR